MTGQMTIFDFQGNVTLAPEMWDCMKSCEHAGENMDKFPGTNVDRCLYGIFLGNDMISEQDAKGKVHFWCRYYKPREDKY